MKAILLAAGRGSRMLHLTEASPKCLVELLGRPLLEWQLESLRLAGITEVAVVTGYRRERLAGYGLVEFHNPHWAQTNMLSSLACAEQWLAGEPCVVSYTDIFYGPQAIRGLMNAQGPLAVSYDPDWRQLWEKRFAQPLLDAETFRLDASGHLSEIGNRPSDIEAIQGQYMGLLRFEPQGWAEVSRIRAETAETLRDGMHMTQALQRVIEAGRLPITTVAYHGSWGEIDSEQDLSASAEAAQACNTALEQARAEVARQAESVAQDIYPHMHRAAQNAAAQTIWITGLSGSGKSTTAYAVQACLSAQGVASQVLDGDNLRHGINKDLGFSLQDRAENIRRTAEIAKLFNEAGLVAIVSLISPLASDRELARSIIGEENFLEVFMSTPIGVCEQRDPKDLYKRARLGQIQNFTGVTSPYQAPSNPDICISSEAATPEQIATTIIKGFVKTCSA